MTYEYSTAEQASAERGEIMYCINCQTNIEGRLDVWCNKCLEYEKNVLISDLNILQNTIDAQKETIRSVT